MQIRQSVELWGSHKFLQAGWFHGSTNEPVCSCCTWWSDSWTTSRPRMHHKHKITPGINHTPELWARRQTHSWPTEWSSRCRLHIWCLCKRGPLSLWTPGRTAAQSWSCRCLGSYTSGRSLSPPTSAVTSGNRTDDGQCNSALGSDGPLTSWRLVPPWDKLTQ